MQIELNLRIQYNIHNVPVHKYSTELESSAWIGSNLCSGSLLLWKLTVWDRDAHFKAFEVTGCVHNAFVPKAAEAIA